MTTDYQTAWKSWDDMIRYSPAPFHRRRQILRLARGLRFASVLDVGCGAGETLAALGRSFDAHLTGVDLAGGAIEEARRRVDGAEFEVLDIEGGSLDRSFDLVLCSEVLEHCAHLHDAVANLRDMTAGHLIVTVPAGPRFPIDRAVGHRRHFTPASLADALYVGGFETLAVRRWGFPFHVAYKLAINARPRAMLERFAGGTYSVWQRAFGTAVRLLFYLSVPRTGWQLVALARPRATDD